MIKQMTLTIDVELDESDIAVLECYIDGIEDDHFEDVLIEVKDELFDEVVKAYSEAMGRSCCCKEGS